MNTHKISFGSGLSRYELQEAFERHDESFDYETRPPRSWKEQIKQNVQVSKEHKSNWTGDIL